jgi:hypothetical protein
MHSTQGGWGCQSPLVCVESEVFLQLMFEVSWFLADVTRSVSRTIFKELFLYQQFLLRQHRRHSLVLPVQFLGRSGFLEGNTLTLVEQLHSFKANQFLGGRPLSHKKAHSDFQSLAAYFGLSTTAVRRNCVCEKVILLKAI